MGEGAEWKGIWGLWGSRGGLLVGWLIEWRVKSKITPLGLEVFPALSLLKIDKNLHFLKIDWCLKTHQKKHTPSLKHSKAFSFSWPAGRRSIRWVRLLECQESNLRSIYKAHILSIHTTHTVHQTKQKENMLTYSADKWAYQLFAHYWVICFS